MLEKLEQLLKDKESKPKSEEVEKVIPQLFEAYKGAMIAAAISAFERAKHWRKDKPTKVGCSLLALGEKLDLSYPAIYTGANIKESPGDFPYPERKCAEMVALENILGMNDLRDDDKDNPGNKGEGIEKGDFGLAVAILTVSENFNTGESDTINHDVLYTCKQCETNIDYLRNKGIVSDKTIICNIRIKDGKPEKIESTTVGELLEKSKLEKEQRNLKTIQDLLYVEKRAKQAYLESIKEITANIFNQRERRERIFAELETYAGSIKDTLKSGVEEGVNKKRLLDSLGLVGINVKEKTKTFNDAELNAITKALFEPLLENLPEPLKE